MPLLGLETSSYLPLVWNTPYTPGIWSLIRRHGGIAPVRGVLHRDSIREASGYFSATNTAESDSKRWMYDPSFRARHLANTSSDADLDRLPFPSTAFAVILGGSIWPAAKYLNYARHCGFMYCDLVDGLDATASKRDQLNRLADLIAARSSEISQVFKSHLSADRITLGSPARYPYWGRLYDGPDGSSIEVQIRDDPPAGKVAADFPTRDAYHYWMMCLEEPRPDAMIVADTGYAKNVREAKLASDIPLFVAGSWTVGGG